MITMIIALAVACGGFAALYFAAGVGIGWSITAALALFIAFQIVFGRVLRKRMTADMERVQLILVEGKKKIQAKMQRWQIRPPGSVQAAQKELNDDMRVFVREALAQTETLRKYRFWVPLIDRQMATAQMQLNWMIKDFSKVDELMPKVIFADPTLSAMKLARLQMLDAPLADITKFYEKSVRRLRYNQNVLPAACYTWILVKRGETDLAFKALTAALKKSDNETLKQNHETLMNNRVAHFTNSALGDQWYALHLEEPKVRQQRQRSVYR